MRETPKQTLIYPLGWGVRRKVCRHINWQLFNLNE